MNADGSGVIRLTYDLAENNSPNWSPDGRWIVYSGNRSGDHEIYSLSPDGAQQNRLTFSPGADEDPVWSPDGYWILFTSDRAQAGLSNLYAMVRDGSRPFAYFETPPTGILTPAWSRK
jgi:TolB protein